ncbi:MAG: hypothetical protein ABF296_05905 [Oceanococcaceae bacterium]
MTVTNAADKPTAPEPTAHGAPGAIAGPGVRPHPRLKALLRLAESAWDAAPAPMDVTDSHWQIVCLNSATCQRKVELILPPNVQALDSALSSSADGLVVDLDALRYATPGAVGAAIRRTADWAAANPAMAVWLRLRSGVDGDRPRGLADAVAYLLQHVEPLTADGAEPRIGDSSGAAGLEIGGICDAATAHRWDCALREVERALGIAQAQVALTIRIDSMAGLLDLDGVLHPLRERTVALRLSMASVLCDLARQASTESQAWQPARQDALRFDYPLADALSKAFTVAAHRRGALALSGMLPALPVRDDPDTHAVAEQSTAELTRQRLRNGHDGVAFAHSAWITAVEPVFADMMPTPNQLERPLDWSLTAADLQVSAAGPVDEAGLRNNVGIAIQALEQARHGVGRFALYNFIEDTVSTALCWTQLWHWARTPAARLDNGPRIDADFLDGIIEEELDIIRLEREARPVEDDQSAWAAEQLRHMVRHPTAPHPFPVGEPG